MKEVTHISGHPRRNVPARIRRKRREAKDAPGESQQLDQVAPLGFYTLDRRGEIRELNEQGAKMLGFPAEWLIGTGRSWCSSREPTSTAFSIF